MNRNYEEVVYVEQCTLWNLYGEYRIKLRICNDTRITIYFDVNEERTKIIRYRIEDIIKQPNWEEFDTRDWDDEEILDEIYSRIDRIVGERLIDAI